MELFTKLSTLSTIFTHFLHKKIVVNKKICFVKKDKNIKNRKISWQTNCVTIKRRSPLIFKLLFRKVCTCRSYFLWSWYIIMIFAIEVSLFWKAVFENWRRSLGFLKNLCFAMFRWNTCPDDWASWVGSVISAGTLPLHCATQHYIAP